MEELNSLCELASRLKSSERKRVGVDGTNGARKSTLAGGLAMELDFQLISIDDFLIKNSGGFVDFIRYDELAERLKRPEGFVIEGVCLLQVLEKINASLDSHVYVKRYRLGLWADELDLDIPTEELEEFLVKNREAVAMLSGAAPEEGPSLSEDIIRYHASYRPQEQAQYVYTWNER